MSNFKSLSERVEDRSLVGDTPYLEGLGVWGLNIPVVTGVRVTK